MRKIPALYIHIPFCKTVCPFCSFAVLKDNQAKHALYIDLLKREFELVKSALNPDLSNVQSVYIGGGTPSLLWFDELSRLVSFLKEQIVCDESCQWSIEVNPDDAGWEYLGALRTMGFNRISLGVQSFNNQALQLLGRSHTVKQSKEAIDSLKMTGFEDFNLDLIFGYQGQSLEDLEMDLYKFLRHDPPHISAYCLNIEEKTRFYRDKRWSDWQERHEDLLFQMYEKVVDTLGDGRIKQYEVSNFAKPGYESKQNLFNWNGENYLGIGMGAHSFVDSSRWGNLRRLVDYRKSVEQGKLPRQFHEELDFFARRDEELMIQLRLASGVNLKEFSKKYQFDWEVLWAEKVEILEKERLVAFREDQLVLATKGIWMADEIAISLASAFPDS